ncbi:MAG: hypothetical protein ACK5JO_01765, partial [Halodesulfovibrio sp.]
SAEIRATLDAMNARLASSHATVAAGKTAGASGGTGGGKPGQASGKSGSAAKQVAPLRTGSLQGGSIQDKPLQTGSTTIPNDAAVPEYTGLVIDARGLGFTPSLHPELHDAGGTIFPSAGLNPQTAATDGLVRYMDSVPAAQQAPRAGSLPYTVKATGTAGGNPAKLSIAPEDAATLRAILARKDNFLDNCKVIIVF